jgi:hypothetical protein
MDKSYTLVNTKDKEEDCAGYNEFTKKRCFDG